MRCEMAYLQGTKSGYMFGAALTSDDDGLDVVPAGGFTQSQTRLAQILQPPAQPAFSGTGCGTIIGLFAVGLPLACVFGFYALQSWAEGSGGLIGILFLGIIGIAGVVGYFCGGQLGSDSEKKEQWQRDAEMWRRKWVCMACGHLWIPG